MEKTINEKLTDSTFLAWIKSKNWYSTRLEHLFREWTRLKKEYTYLEYDYLLRVNSNSAKK